VAKAAADREEEVKPSCTQDPFHGDNAAECLAGGADVSAAVSLYSQGLFLSLSSLSEALSSSSSLRCSFSCTKMHTADVLVCPL